MTDPACLALPPLQADVPLPAAAARWHLETEGWTWYTWLSYYIPFFGWIRTYKIKEWLLVRGTGG